MRHDRRPHHWVPLQQGWSGASTAGLAMTFAQSALVSLGGEHGGIGSDTHIWTLRARGSVPFWKHTKSRLV